ncbi:hypothetical protein CI109_106612 [Kwoniella shandongensis]|uniref:DUF5745 domain-containing protein n=1 Tax=Kwoniella shandongensis TaxID=1734106 RepID=A0A5M6BU01_9TREE|nr:uncharacterized protein CI109_007154 [Kwoniella shandongensis]KAA5524499.1 hypothetical protein CI109_007154 [Kwoniella shandongensis]
MPTPPLPLLHQLLSALRIPVLPPSLGATPPSLLLIILESILSTRLPLPHPIRLCQTTEDELAVTKCILGVLADDILGMDLSVIDPVRVVKGKEQEMSVIIMALVVVARRKGLTIRLPIPEPEDQRDQSMLADQTKWLPESEEDLSIDLPPPLAPDISYPSGLASSPLRPSQTPVDVFGSWRPPTSRSTSFYDDPIDNNASTYDGELNKEMLTSPARQSFSPYDLSISSNEFDPYVTPLQQVEHQDRTNHHEISLSHSSLETTTSNKTVLQHMLEEFGLDLDSR